MVLPTASEKVPPGYRFYPTDEELIVYYLTKKVRGESILGDAVSELDIYDFSPWDLPELGSLRNRNLIAYFFCPRRERRRKSGKESRLTESGFWKATGEDRRVLHKGRLVGKRKTLIFYLAKPPKDERTNWVMHEYRLVDTQPDGVDRDSYVLCKIFKKSGLGPKNGEQYGAPFNEKEWEDNNETQGIPASTSPTEGPSNCNNQEDSAVTGILVPGHHYSGIVASSREPVSLENGAVSSVDLPDPNACRDVVPILEGSQGQSMVIVINNETSVEGLFEPNSNRTDAGMLAHATGQDQVMQDANFDGLINGLIPLEEEFYPSNNYAPQETDPDGDYLEHRDLFGALPSDDLPDPNACRDVVPIPEGPQGQYQVGVVFDELEPLEYDLCAGSFNNAGYAHQVDFPAGDFLEQREIDNWPTPWFEGLSEPNSNRKDAGMLAHATGQDQVMQDANFDGLISGLIPLEEEFYPINNYAPQETDAAGDFLEHRDLFDALPSDDLPDPNACRNVVPIPEGPQGQYQVGVVFDELEPLEYDLRAGRFNNAGYAHQVDFPDGDFLEQRDIDNWPTPWFEGLSEPNSNRTDAGMLAHAAGQDQVMQDANFDGLISGLIPLEEEFYPSNNYAPQETDPAGDFLEHRDLFGALPSDDLPDPNACRNVVPIPEGSQGQY